MAECGFVYALSNDKMPGIYKVGCTERSPRERAAELSKASGVPVPFEVLFYLEARDFQTVERKFHEWLADCRVSPDREFFECDLKHLVGIFYFYPGRLSFCDATARPERVDHDIQRWFTSSCLCDELGVNDFAELHNPFDTRATERSMDSAVEIWQVAQGAARLRIVGGADDEPF